MAPRAMEKLQRRAEAEPVIARWHEARKSAYQTVLGSPELRREGT